MAKGDVVLITFPFIDLSGSKLRPAVVLIETQQDITAAFITTQVKWKEPTDLELQPCDQSGIKAASIVRTNKIATLDKALVRGLIGKLSAAEMAALNAKLRMVLQLS